MSKPIKTVPRFSPVEVFIWTALVLLLAVGVLGALALAGSDVSTKVWGK